MAGGSGFLQGNIVSRDGRESQSRGHRGSIKSSNSNLKVPELPQAHRVPPALKIHGEKLGPSRGLGVSDCPRGLPAASAGILGTRFTPSCASAFGCVWLGAYIPCTTRSRLGLAISMLALTPFHPFVLSPERELGF